MVEVTNDNFDDVLPDVLSDIKSSSFVGIDTEFTGLLIDPIFKNSLFDDGPHRYQKLCSNLRKVIICQLGLAFYKGVPHTNAYTVTSYNFYLRPQSSVTYDPTFVCQSSSLEFLRKYNFDFNKWLYGGIHFMNTEDSMNLQNALLALLKGDKITDISYELQDQISDIGSWAVTAQEGDTMTVNCKENMTNGFMLRVMIRHRFSDLWSDEEDGEVIVKKVSQASREAFLKEDPDGIIMVKDHVSKMLGFTIIFQQLAAFHKPLVFHNGLLDLLLIYKAFHQNLPHSYMEFKRDLHEMFPMIYDTKYIATELKKEFKDKDDATVNGLLGSTALLDLARSLKRDTKILHFPVIKHYPLDRYSTDAYPHEAGYDAFLTGFCFLSLAHIYAMFQMPSVESHRPLSPREHLYALKNFANGIMVQRAGIQSMSLSGNDPKSKRPPWLLIEGRRNAVVSPGMVYSAVAQYGLVDVIPRNRRSVLVASSSWECTRNILRNLDSEGPLRAVRYNQLKHSLFTRTLAWSGALLSTGLSAWLIYSTLKRTSR